MRHIFYMCACFFDCIVFYFFWSFCISRAWVFGNFFSILQVPKSRQRVALAACITMKIAPPQKKKHPSMQPTDQIVPLHEIALWLRQLDYPTGILSTWRSTDDSEQLAAKGWGPSPHSIEWFRRSLLWPCKVGEMTPYMGLGPSTFGFACKKKWGRHGYWWPSCNVGRFDVLHRKRYKTLNLHCVMLRGPKAYPA